ncbi:hypothetical protein DFH07DRAFT_783358 [Mycena maculata]|uniref:Uncharacterized protein n=1 Tax=Mycena maculata TaxID=230809 RepID=A0AAD7HN31_9AGAR|nr:hypothetical protein DFH07DRAFT_783358 [Mycena maculata]
MYTVMLLLSSCCTILALNLGSRVGGSLSDDELREEDDGHIGDFVEYIIRGGELRDEDDGRTGDFVECMIHVNGRDGKDNGGRGLEGAARWPNISPVSGDKYSEATHLVWDPFFAAQDVPQFQPNWMIRKEEESGSANGIVNYRWMKWWIQELEGQTIPKNLGRPGGWGIPKNLNLGNFGHQWAKSLYLKLEAWEDLQIKLEKGEIVEEGKERMNRD